jgi:hypothetical protein
MAEFTRSRLDKKAEDEITKKTIFLGLITVLVLVLTVVFGLPLLVRFSILLGDLKNKQDSEIVEKVIPPMMPRLILPFEATNSARIDLRGVAEKGVSIELLKNDVSVGKVETDEAGEFVFKDIFLEAGESIFTAVAISKAGDSSEISKELTLAYDNEVPPLTMTNPSEASVKVESDDFDVVGVSEKGVSVTVNGRVAMVDDSGSFKLKLQLAIGKNEVEIIVRDLAGNETKKKIEITYDI